MYNNAVIIQNEYNDTIKKYGELGKDITFENISKISDIYGKRRIKAK